MFDRSDPRATFEPDRSRPAARYVSSNDLADAITLLVELRDLTLSRRSYVAADRIIQALGGKLAKECERRLVEAVD